MADKDTDRNIWQGDTSIGLVLPSVFNGRWILTSFARQAALPNCKR